VSALSQVFPRIPPIDEKRALARDLGRPVYAIVSQLLNKPGACADTASGPSKSWRLSTYPLPQLSLNGGRCCRIYRRAQAQGYYTDRPLHVRTPSVPMKSSGLKENRGAKTAMTLALRSSEIINDIVSVDNAPLDAALLSNFGKYIQAMKKIEDAGVTRQAEADTILKDYEEVSAGQT
jgi:hypothetical protein